jgi:hypothetical protein
LSGGLVADYSTFIAKTEAFELSDSFTDYKVATETNDSGGLSYKISARFGFNTPLGEIIPWLEAGGTVSFTRDGQEKFVVLEVPDGTPGT